MFWMLVFSSHDVLIADVDRDLFSSATKTLHLSQIKTEDLKNWIEFGQKVIQSLNTTNTSDGSQTPSISNGNESTFSTLLPHNSDRLLSSASTSPGKMSYASSAQTSETPSLITLEDKRSVEDVFSGDPSVSIHLSLTNLFEKSVPDWYTKQLFKILPFLTECGLTINFVCQHLVHNWERIRNNPAILDVSCHVGSCHVQAAYNRELIEKYWDSPKKMSIQNASYIVMCLLISDHSEIRYGEESVGGPGGLHRPDYAKTLLNPELLVYGAFKLRLQTITRFEPLKVTTTDESTGQKTTITTGRVEREKKVDAVIFFHNLRVIAAMQALVGCSPDKQWPRFDEDARIMGLRAPKSYYPETFELLFSKMVEVKMPFIVRMRSVSNPEMEGQPHRLSSEYGVGFYSKENAHAPRKESCPLVIELCSMGLPQIEVREIVEQMRDFQLLKQTITEIVRLSHTKEDPEKISARFAAYNSGDISTPTGYLKQYLFTDPKQAEKFSSSFGRKLNLSLVKYFLALNCPTFFPIHIWCGHRGILEELGDMKKVDVSG